jgi:hypothetical protein
MENKAPTKTPIPIHREFLFWILSPVFRLLSSLFRLPYSVFCLLSPVFRLLSSVFCPTRPSCPACRPSTNVERALQIALFFAKQSQFQNGQYKHKYSKNKGVCQRTTNDEPRTLLKTNPIKPNSPAPSQRSAAPQIPRTCPKSQADPVAARRRF